MIRTVRVPRPSPAMVVALVAFSIALGGTGYAATKLPADSVGAKQLKKDAVSSAEVKDGSLLPRDFKPGQLPSGEPGRQGDQGPKGDPGAKGDTGATGAPGARGQGVQTIVVRYGSTVIVPSSGPIVRDGFASCNAGERATGGGAKLTNDPADPPAANESGVWDSQTVESGPTTTAGNPIPAAGATPTGWHVGIHNGSASKADVSVILNPYVICAA